jgi:elongation factor Ts
MEINAIQVKKLREKTGAGVMDCKAALAHAEGDIDKAVEYLRKTGVLKAAKKADRPTGDGLIASYIHPGAKLAVLVEINCETDFVARTDDFQTLAKDVAMHIAAQNPLVVSREEIPAGLLEKEREIYRAQAVASGKPEKIVDKIVDGQVEKFYSEVCLLEQPFVKDPKISVDDLLKQLIAKVGENIRVARFVRLKLGEQSAAEKGPTSHGSCA